jgi:hypothetical protein
MIDPMDSPRSIRLDRVIAKLVKIKHENQGRWNVGRSFFNFGFAHIKSHARTLIFVSALTEETAPGRPERPPATGVNSSRSNRPRPFGTALGRPREVAWASGTASGLSPGRPDRPAAVWNSSRPVRAAFSRPGELSAGQAAPGRPGSISLRLPQRHV